MSDWYTIENADEVPTPALLVYPHRVRQNLQRLIGLTGDASLLRPHVKTHKMPQVIRMKRELGIDKFKVSTIAEAEMTARAGGQDVLLAYQPVGPNIQRLISLSVSYPGTQFSTIVDNRQSLRELATAATTNHTNIPVALDLNVGMNRTGIAPGPEALALYRDIYQTPGVSVMGLHAYDGHLHVEEEQSLQSRVDHTFQLVWELRDALLRDGLPVPTIIASGTPTASIHGRRGNVEIGAGTAVFWDFGQEVYSPDMGIQHAAVLMGRVISRPTLDRICVDVGHKAVASEMPQPRIRWFGLESAVPVTHSEEHLVLQTSSADQFPVGTVLYGIPQHICPTVALHQFAWTVQNQRAVGMWNIAARDRFLTI